MRIDWKTVVGLGVTAVLFWWLFRNEDPAEIWASVRGANFGLLALAVTIATVGFLVRAIRWRYYLEPVQPDSPLRSRFESVCIGFMCNNLLAARVGEFVRAFAYSRMEPVTTTRALGTLVVERVLDGVAILILFFAATVHPSFPADGLPALVVTATRTVSVSLAVLVVIAGLMVAFPDAGLSVFGSMVRRLLPSRWAERTLHVAEGFVHGLEALKSPRLLFWGLAWSLGFWLFQSLSFWVGLRAFDIDLPFMAAAFMNGTIAFWVAFPAAPGFFGTFHAGAKVALVDVYGVAAAPALGFAFGWHLGSFFPVTLLGLWYARKLGLSFADMQKGGAG